MDDGGSREINPLDWPDGATVEGLAGSLIAEAEAVNKLRGATSVFIRRGDNSKWREITAAELRARRAGLDWP